MLRLLLFIMEVFGWLIIARVIISFLPLYSISEQLKRLLQVLYNITEPVLQFVRKRLPNNSFGIDFSPYLVLLALSLLRILLIRIFG